MQRKIKIFELHRIINGAVGKLFFTSSKLNIHNVRHPINNEGDIKYLNHFPKFGICIYYIVGVILDVIFG